MNSYKRVQRKYLFVVVNQQGRNMLSDVQKEVVKKQIKKLKLPYELVFHFVIPTDTYVVPQSVLRINTQRLYYTVDIENIAVWVDIEGSTIEVAHKSFIV